MLKGLRLQKKYIAFFTLVPLISLTAIVNADCPVCKGDGQVISNPEIENVKITGIQSTEIDTIRDACGMFLIYNFDIIVSIENHGPDEAVGWMQMYQTDYIDGKLLDFEYTVVTIPGKTAWDVRYRVSFLTGHDEPRRTEVHAELLQGEVPCDTCHANGRIPVNMWPIVNALKNNFLQLYEAERPWSVPQWPVDDEQPPM